MRGDAHPSSVTSTSTSTVATAPAVAGYLPRWEWLRRFSLHASAGAVECLDKAFSTQVGLSRWYEDLFHRLVLEGEWSMVGVEPGARLLPIGKRVLPYADSYLPRRVLVVHAADHDPG